MLFIGICGASGSGKSTLAEELATMVNKSILIINQDAYYKNHPDLSFEKRCLLNYDEPSIFDHDQLLEDVRELLNGRRVSRLTTSLHNILQPSNRCLISISAIMSNTLT